MSSASVSIYVFDLDGVITDARNSVVNEDVVDHLYGLLAQGNPVAVNTGRAYDWVDQNLVRRLLTRQDEDIFSRLLIVCEKGGESITISHGEPTLCTSEFALHPEAYERTKMIFDGAHAELSTMFWDAGKRTMATVEKRPTAALDTFHEQQHLLVDKLKMALAGYDIRIDVTTIATDVESSAAGKHAGAELILRWIQQSRPVEALQFISFGDSKSDYEMARYFAEQQYASTFVYVGRPTESISQHPAVVFTQPGPLYSEGALQFLEKLSASDHPLQTRT